MKKMRIIVAIMLMATMFCLGCSEKEPSTPDETSQQQTEDHDHGDGEDAHTH